MSDKKYYQTALFTAIFGVIVLAIVSISLSTQYENSLVDIARLEERIESERDSYYAEIFAKPLCKDVDGLRAVSRPLDETRIKYLEGQLLSCTSVYIEERHERKYYQKALENAPPYCSEGLDQLAIAGLKDELQWCYGRIDSFIQRYVTEPRYDLVERNLCDADAECSACAVMTMGDYRYCFDNVYSPEDLRGAPCHPHPDGIHCGWEPCTMLFECYPR